MNDEQKAEMVEAAMDGVNFSELKKECFRLKGLFLGPITDYPNIAMLAGMLDQDVSKLPIKEVALLFGKKGKIPLIKEIRRRHKISLYEAKMMSDGIFENLGW